MPAVGDDLAVSDPVARPVLAALRRGRRRASPGGRGARRAGAPVVVLEAMKMEHEVLAEVDGVVRELAVAVGEAVRRASCWRRSSRGPGRRGRPRGRAAGSGDGARARGRAGRPAGRPRAPRDRPRPRASGRGRPPPRARPADGAGEPRRADRRGHVRRVRAAAVRRPGAPAQPRGADRAHARRRPRRWRRRGGRPPLRGHVLRLHGAGGHPGDAQPRQEGPPVRARRAPPAAGRAVRRGRRRAARATWTCRSSPGSTAAPSRCSRRSAVSCRWWASRRATASPATPPCSAAATL